MDSEMLVKIAGPYAPAMIEEMLSGHETVCYAKGCKLHLGDARCSLPHIWVSAEGNCCRKILHPEEFTSDGE